MNVLLTTNSREGKGLYKDSIILASLLDEIGHSAMIVDFRDNLCIPADLVIHLEVVVPELFQSAERQWWVPNVEWSKPEYVKHIDQFEHVLCKTKDAYRIFSELSDKAIHTGFMSEDRLDPSIKRERSFFHAAGENIAKGTDAIEMAWKTMSYPLTINRTATEEQHRMDQNRCLFHLCPSRAEGWGHSLHESLSVGAVTVTTDLPPMNEFAGVAYRIPPTSFSTQNLAKIGYVDATGVKNAAEWCMGLSDARIKMYSEEARCAYEDECLKFKAIFKELV